MVTDNEPTRSLYELLIPSAAETNCVLVEEAIDRTKVHDRVDPSRQYGRNGRRMMRR